jgi:hypothetical protein
MVNDFVSPLRQRHKPGRDHRTLPAYVLFFFLVLPCGSFAQALLPSSARITIADGTPVKLQLARTIFSAHVHRGDLLDFEVVEDVKAGGLTVIRAGTMARGSVAEITRMRLLGLGSKLIIKLDSVDLVTGDTVRLDGRRQFIGRSRTRLMAEGMLLAGLIYLPAAPVLLLSQGRESIVLKGTEVTAYIEGDFQVQLTDLAKARESVPSLDEMIAILPPRVLDRLGHEGDMINLIFIAKENDFEQVFARAGWVQVDKLKVAAVWHFFCQRRHYVKLPMDTLYVFGRAPNYSYALPDPTAILTRRHHLRVWKTDYEVNGSPIWVGAATHDVALTFSILKPRPIHRIDPNVDAERDFIARNLTATHLVTQVEYLSSAFPVFQAQTVSGETYHSDSRMLLLNFSQRPAPTLAATLARDHTLEGPLLSFAK